MFFRIALVSSALGVLFTAHAANAAAIYVSQSGSGDGSSCTNARSVSWLNTSSNWGSGSTQVSPGSTVYLCGTINTGISFLGSGSSGNVITMDGSSATISATFTVRDRSYWRIQNMKWAPNFKSQLLLVFGGSNGVFTKNTADGVSGDPAVYLAQGSTLPNNITVSYNSIRTTSDDLGNTQMDIIKTEGSTNVVIEGNYLEMRAGGAGGNAHDDVIQTYESGSSSSKGNPRDWTIRYNQIVMNSDASADRSWMMLENLGGTINVYGNLFLGLKGASGANGIASNSNESTIVFNFYNNTIVSKPGATNNIFNLQTPGTANLRNNIVYTAGQTLFASNMKTVRDHNLWFGSTPSCSGLTGELCGVNPNFKDYTNNDFSLTQALAGVALGAGFNLDILGKTRGADGVWDMGAYEFGGAATVLQAPTNLRIVQ
jgi:hypothetical protein